MRDSRTILGSGIFVQSIPGSRFLERQIFFYMRATEKSITYMSGLLSVNKSGMIVNGDPNIKKWFRLNSLQYNFTGKQDELRRTVPSMGKT